MSVSLVGAGPGDPGLITVRGRELLARADVIIYDALADPGLLGFARPDAELIYVGKIAGKHALPQPEINSLLAEKGARGNVVRLKGGDPYIFGRGGEEGEYLAAHGIPFEEVPGISSAIAAPAYAGIPLTHRDFVSSLMIITGHEKDGGTRHDWRAFVQSRSTLVFVMGMKNLPEISRNLIAAGMDPQMPAAAIYRGTTPEQRAVAATVADLPAAAAAAGIANPAVIVVGQVVTLRQKLDWFAKKPLLGRTVVVTRAREQASELAKKLEALGARVLECPAIEIRPVSDYGACDLALERLPEYAWLIFTSVNGVKYFWERLALTGRDTRSLGARKVAAIGPATAHALKTVGVNPDLVPPTYVAEAVAGELKRQIGKSLAGMKILLPRAAKARMALPDALAEAGAAVDVVPLYETVAASGNAGAIRELLAAGGIDCISFGSSSTVDNFLGLVPADEIRSHPETILAAIGPITAQTLAGHGLKAQIQPASYTIPALADAIAAWFAEKQK